MSGGVDVRYARLPLVGSRRQLLRRRTTVYSKGTGGERDAITDLGTLSWCPNVNGFAAWHGYSATSCVDWLCLTFVSRTLLVQQCRITCQMYLGGSR